MIKRIIEEVYILYLDVKVYILKVRLKRMMDRSSADDMEEFIRFHSLGFRLRTVIEGEGENGHYRTHIYEASDVVAKLTRFNDDEENWELDWRMEIPVDKLRGRIS